jgi:acyl-CoA reductase-like NAD-dependent aldehyde dehydrogenase
LQPAAQAGQLQLNAFEPVIAYRLFKSLTHLCAACYTLGDPLHQRHHGRSRLPRCVDGRALDKIMQHVSDALARGGVLLAGGAQVQPDGSRGPTCSSG